MEAIINFFTGTLNTVAWLYIFLPCTIIGGLYLTIRNRGIQFTRFGYAMKNTVGKMFQKQEAGAGAVTPLQAVTTAPAISSAPRRPSRSAATAQCSGCGWRRCSV